MQISFIIPAYNAQNTIINTLESIYSLSLELNLYEIIVVDDCSTDNTVQIVEQYEKRYNNIKLIRQIKNNRQGAARNRGIMYAKGEYVVLVDSDDVVLPGLINALEYALQTQVDIMHCGVELQQGTMIKNVVSRAPKNVVLSGFDFCEKYHTVESCQAPWAYLYKNNFLQKVNIQFEEGRRLEDTDWVEKHLALSETIASVESSIYLYKENPTSTMHTVKYDTNADWLHFSYRRLIFANAIKNRMPQYSERLTEAGMFGVINNTTLRRLTRFSPLDYFRIRKRCGNECIEYLSRIEWCGFTKIVINMPIITFLILLFACPFVRIGRIFKQNIKK